MSRSSPAFLSTFVLLLTGCLGGSGPVDPGDAGPQCTTDEDCDDEIFCNGLELCAPDEEGALANGCLVGTPPCGEQPCLEEMDTCELECPDGDGDGQEDAACGGTDCDDSDRNVFLGATEVCDQAGIDDDCDPTTLGIDADEDGFPSTRCCNGPPGGLRCGEDCDDARASANPDAPEVCNGLDDDCDGSLDEGVTITFYRDADGDSYGDVTVTMEACSPPTGWTILSGDCNDANPNISPGRPESCLVRGADDDCDGNIDEICDCSPADPPITCGPGAPEAGRGVCRDGTQVCSSAGTYGDCMGGVYPGVETCDGLDEDCDGRVDEGGGRACPQSASVSGTTACGRAGVRRCGADCQWLDSAYLAAGETAESCDYCVDTSGGWAAERVFASTTNNDCRGGLLNSCPPGVPFTAIDLSGDARVVDAFGTVELNAGVGTGAGSAWFPSMRLGYGQTTIEAQVSSSIVSELSSAHGWAVSVVRDGPPNTGPGDAFGAPRALLSARWRHAGGGSRTRAFTVREDGTQIWSVEDANSASAEPSTSRGRAQQFRLTITVDDPITSANETAIEVLAYHGYTDAMGFQGWDIIGGTGTSSQIGCRAAGCGFVLRAGDAIRVALSGGGVGAPAVRHMFGELEVITRDACSPE